MAARKTRSKRSSKPPVKKAAKSAKKSGPLRTDRDRKNAVIVRRLRALELKLRDDPSNLGFQGDTAYDVVNAVVQYVLYELPPVSAASDDPGMSGV